MVNLTTHTWLLLQLLRVVLTSEIGLKQQEREFILTMELWFFQTSSELL